MFSKVHDTKRMDTLRYYSEVLGVRPGASLQEINQAYINHLNKLHPSRLSNDPRQQQKAQAAAQEINEAYREIKRVYTLRRGGAPSFDEEYVEPELPAERTLKPAKRVRPPKREKDGARAAFPRPPLKGALLLVAAVSAIVIAVKSFGPAPAARQSPPATPPEAAPRKHTTAKSKPAVVHEASSIPEHHTTRRSDSRKTAEPAERNSAPAAPESAGQAVVSRPSPPKQTVTQPAAAQADNLAVQHALAVRKAAERGDSVAQARLGYLYMNGKGVPQDYAEAARWYRKAAEQGHVGGEYWLGYQCETGQGVPPNLGEAARWYRRAAEQGDVEAQKRLALLYLQGRGVAKDSQEAEKWYSKAAGQGDPDAQSALNGLTGR